jgi:hypothetical protein
MEYCVSKTGKVIKQYEKIHKARIMAMGRRLLREGYQ